MNSDQILMFVRQIMISAGGGFITSGYITASMWEAFVGAIVTLAGLGWAFWKRRQNGIIASAAAVPGVSAIIATPAIANAIPDPKVQV